jgi:hypothetical protein
MLARVVTRFVVDPGKASQAQGVRQTQLDAAFAEGFNRGQREARQVRKSRERSVPAFDPDGPDSF